MLKEKDKGHILLVQGRMGLPGYIHQQKSRKKEFVVDSGGSMHVVSKTLTLLSLRS